MSAMPQCAVKLSPSSPLVIDFSARVAEMKFCLCRLVLDGWESGNRPVHEAEWLLGLHVEHETPLSCISCLDEGQSGKKTFELPKLGGE